MKMEIGDISATSLSGEDDSLNLITWGATGALFGRDAREKGCYKHRPIQQKRKVLRTAFKGRRSHGLTLASLRANCTIRRGRSSSSRHCTGRPKMTSSNINVKSKPPRHSEPAQGPKEPSGQATASEGGREVIVAEAVFVSGANNSTVDERRSWKRRGDEAMRRK